jgi:hypothetical protein
VIKYALVITIIVICSFSWVAESHSITIAPARFEARLPAGEVAGIDYYAQNDTDGPIHVTVEPENWLQNVYDYSGIAASDWIKAEPREFDLKPKEIKKVRVTVRVPKKAKGELVAQIFFTSAISGASDAAGGSIKSRLGAVLYVAIKDTEKVNAEIGEISVSGLKIDEKDGMKIDVLLRNKGNVHIRPAEGRVAVSDVKGREISQLHMATDYSVVPGQEFAYTVSWDNPALAEGKYKVSAFIKYGRMYTREREAKFEKWFMVDKAGKVIVE